MVTIHPALRRVLGKVRQNGKRKNPSSSGQWRWTNCCLRARPKTFQFKIVDEGNSALRAPPSFSVIVTANSPTRRWHGVTRPKRDAAPAPALILHLPLRPPGRFEGQSHAGPLPVGGAGSGHGLLQQPVGLEEIVPLTYDVEYDYRASGRGPLAAIQFVLRPISIGSATGITSEDRAETRSSSARSRCPGTIQSSAVFPKSVATSSPLNGVTDDGRVAVTDSALWKTNGLLSGSRGL